MKLFLQALNGEKTTRPPFWFMRQAGRYLPEYREIRARAGDFLSLCHNPELAEEVTLQPLRRYHMDAAILFADILLLPHAMGQALAYKEGEGPVLDPIRSNEDLHKLDTENFHSRLSAVYETVERLSHSVPQDTALIGFAGAPWTVATYMIEGRGGTDFGQAKRWAMTDKQGFSQFMDLLANTTAEYLIRQIEAGAEAIQIFDSWAGAVPEALFDLCCLRPVQTIARKIRQRFPQVPVIAFPRAAGPLYLKFTEIAEIDAVSLDSTMPLAWARDHLQRHKTVQGNLDPQYLLVGGEAMLTEARRIMRHFADGPFVFNLGHGILQQTSPETVAELSECIRKGA